MSEIVGSLAIQIELDRTKLDRELKNLESLKAQQLTFAASLDTRAFRQQVNSLGQLKPTIDASIRLTNINAVEQQLRVLGRDRSIKIGVAIDESKLTNLEQRLKGYADRSFKVTAQVDDRQLTALNKHSDLKQKHFGQVNNYFKSNPLTPRVNFSHLDTLDRRLSGLKGKAITVNATVKYATTQPSNIAQTVTQKLQVDTGDFEKAIGKSVGKAFKQAKSGDLLGGLGSIISAPLKLATSAIAGVGGTIASSLIFSITQPLGAGLGQGVSRSLEKAVSSSFGSTELLGKHLGKELLEGVESIFNGTGIQKVVKKATQGISQTLQQSPEFFVETRAATARQKQQAAQKRKLAEPELVEEVRVAAAKKPQIQEAVVRAETARPQLKQDLQAYQEKLKATQEQAQKRANLITVERTPEQIAQQKNQRKQQLEQASEALAKQGKLQEAVRLRQAAANLPTFTAKDISPQEVATNNQTATANARNLFIAGSIAKLKPEREALLKRVRAVQEDDAFVAKSLADLEKAATGLDLVRTASANDPKPKQKAKQKNTKNLPSVYRQIFDEVAQIQGVKNGKIPELAIDEKLAPGTLGDYTPELNQIRVSPALAKAAQEGKLTLKQTEALVHEIEHAFQTGFGALAGKNESAVKLIQPTFEESARLGKNIERSTASYAKQTGKTDDPFARKLEADAYTFADRNTPAIFERVQRSQAVSNLESSVGVGGGKLELKLANAQKLVFQKISELSQASTVDVSEELAAAIAGAEKAAASIKPFLNKLQDLDVLPVDEIAALQQELLAQTNAAVNEVLGQAKSFAGAIAAKPTQVREQVTGSLEQFNRKKTLVPLAQEFGIEDADKLKKSELISQLTNQVDLRQLQPRVNQLTRDRAQQQIANRERNAAIAQTAGSVARGSVNAGRSVFGAIQTAVGSEQAQAILGAASNTAKGLGAVAKASYKLASGIEAIALDALPFGRLTKGVLQQTALPAATFAAATHFLPGGQIAAEGLGNLVGGAVSPLVQGASSGLSASASEFIASALPHALGIQGAATSATTGLISSAATTIGELAVNAGTVILGGKLIQGTVGKAGATALKSALPPEPTRTALPAASNRALPQASVDAAKPEAEIIADPFQGLTRPQLLKGAQKLGIQGVNSKTTKETLTDRLRGFRDQGEVDRVLAQVQSEIGRDGKPVAGFDQKAEKEALKRFAQAEKEINKKLAQVQAATGAKREKLINEILSQTQNAIAEIDKLKGQNLSGETVRSLSGTQGRIENTVRNNPTLNTARNERIQVVQQSASQSRERNITGLARVEPDQPGLFGGLTAKFKALLPNQQSRADRLKRNYEAFYREIANLSGVAFDPKNLPRLEVNAAKLKQSGAQAFYDIEQNVITIDGAIAKILSKKAQELSQYEKQLQGLTHESRHSIQLDGGKRTLEEAAAGNLSDGRSLTRSQRSQVAGSVEVARRQGASGSQLSAIGKLETDAYDFEKNTSVILARVGAQFKNPSAITSIRSAVSNAIKTGIDVVSESLEGIQKAIPGLSRISFDARLNLANGKASPLSTADLENSDTGLASPSRRKRRLFNRRLASGNFTPPSLDNGPDFNGLVDRGVKQAEKQALEAEYLRADANAIREIEAVKRRQQQQRKKIRGAIRAILNPEQFLQQRSENATLTNARSLLDNSEEIVGRVQTSINQSPENKRRAKLDLDPVISPTQAKGIAQVQSGYGRLGQAAEIYQGDKSKKNLLELRAAIREVENGLKTLKVPTGLDPLTQGFEKLGSPLGRLGGLAKNAIAGLVGFQILSNIIPQLQQFASESLAATIKLDNLKTALNFATGSEAGGAKALAFARSEAERLGISLDSAQEGYKRLLTSAKGTGLEGSVNKLFSGVGSASTVLGLTGDQQGRAFLAFEQIINKGKVSTEELNQLAEAGLSGAFDKAAKAIGVTGGELAKLLESGSVLSKDFIPKISEQLISEFGGSAEKASQNIQSAIFRMQSSFQKLQESTGAAIAPAALVGIQALTAGLNVLSANGQQITQTFLLVSSIIGVQLLGGIAKIPLVAKLASLGIGEIGAGLLKLAPAAAAFALQFLAVNLAIETGKTIFEQFVPSDLGNQFKGFADQGEASLDRIAKAARIARGEVERVGSKPKSTSKGFDLTLGVGNALGLGTVKSDDLLKGVNKLQRKVNRFTGADENFGTLTTVEDIQNQRDAEQLDRFRGTTRNLVGQGLDSKSIAANLRKTQGFDQQLEGLRNQRSLINSTSKPDKLKLAELDKQEKTLSAEREKAAGSVNSLSGGITSQLSNARAALTNPDISETDKGKLQEDIKLLEKAEANVNKLTSAIRTSASAAKDLNNAFLESAVRLETIAEKNTETFKRRQIGNTKTRIKNFSTDVDASIVNPLVDATDTRDKAKVDLESNRIELEKLARAIDTPANAALLGTIKIGSTGKTIDKNSSIAELEDAKKGLKDSEADKKNVVDRLIDFKKNRQKLTDLEGEYQDKELALIKAKEAAKLAAIDKASAQRESRIKRQESTATVRLIQKKVGKSVSDEDSAIEEASIAATGVNARIASTQQELSEVQKAFQQKLLSAEEYEKKRRGLEDSLSDAVVRQAQAELAIVEAKNRKILEGYDRISKRANAAINTEFSERTNSSKLNQLNGKGMTGEGGQSEILAAEIDASVARLNLKDKEFAEVEELRNRGIISEKEAEDRRMQIKADTQQMETQVIEQITQQRLRAIQNEVDAEKRSSDAKVALLDREKAAQDKAIAQLEQRKSLLDAELNLTKSISDSRQSALKIGVDRASESADLFKQLGGLKGEKGAQTFQRKRILREQLGGFGANPDDKKGIVGAIQNKQALEAEADAEKTAALLKQQELERESVRLGLLKEQSSTRIAVIEAKRAELLAKQNLNSAKGELSKALKTGDRNEIANAQSNVDLAQEGISLAAQGTGLAQGNVGAIDERLQKELQANDIKQARSRRELDAQNEANKRQRDRELATTADEVKYRGSLNFSGVAPSAVANFNPIEVAGIQPQTSAVDQAVSRASNNQDVVAKLEQLYSGIIQLANSPRSLSFSTPDPVSDYAKYQNEQAGSTLRGL